VRGPYRADPNRKSDNAAFYKCVGFRDTDSDLTGEAHSDEFVSGRLFVSADAQGYRSPADIASNTALLRSPKAPACYEQLLAGTGPPGLKVDSVSVNVVPGTNGGPSNVVATLTATFLVEPEGGQQPASVTASTQLPLYMTDTFLAGPLTETGATIVSSGSPVPAALVKRIVAAEASRLSKGLTGR
jgi:hypothetical protein